MSAALESAERTVINDEQIVINELSSYEFEIAKQERTGICARWGFGHVLIQQRNGRNQLPNGLLDAVKEKFNLGKTEISQRMQFAAQVPREEVSACANTYGTWNRIKRELLPNKPKPDPRADDDAGWVERAEKRIAKLLEESGQSDTRHDAFVGILARALNDVTYPAEVGGL